jgi:hypothetical protein
MKETKKKGNNQKGGENESKSKVTNKQQGIITTLHEKAS